MKTLALNKRFFVITLVVAVLFAVNMFGQTNVEQKLAKHPSAVLDLVNGIKSENDGLRRTSIYLAGKYQLEQTVDVLIMQMGNEKIPSNRILIALSLFRIGEERGMNLILQTALSDIDPEVRRICSALVVEQNNSLKAPNNF